MASRLLLVVPIYAILYAASYVAASLLRADFDLSPTAEMRLYATLPWMVAIKIAVFLQSREWRRLHRYTTLADIGCISVAAVTSTAAIFITGWWLGGRNVIPRSVLLIDLGLSVLMTSLLRSLVRVYLQSRKNGSQETVRAIIFSAGDVSVAMLRTVTGSNHPFRIVAFYEEAAQFKSRIIGGIPVFGAPEDLIGLAKRLDAHAVLIPASLQGRRVRALLQECQAAGLKAHLIPDVGELVEGRFRLSIRDVEISDLLRREPAQLDLKSIQDSISGRRVLVTGAAGSIGSELCRQILSWQPVSLTLVDQSESGLFQIEQEILHGANTGVLLDFRIADITDDSHMTTIFEDVLPEIVFHAAAYKHVPMMEANPREAIRNNTLGTRLLAELAGRFEVERFVLISTDKAVRPTSVMGSSKLLAELCLQVASQKHATKFITVRFGNVLNSVGSVVPIFRSQIEKGGPITVTHPDMVRFFMTIPEAVQLVLQAGAIGESGDVLILDMGEPVRIVDLARDMILLSGMRYPEDIDIVFTGMRPGEKLYEELFYESEANSDRIHEKIFRGTREPISAVVMHRHLDSLERLLDGGSNSEIRNTLRGCIENLTAADLDTPIRKAA